MVLTELNGRYTYINKITQANEELIVKSLFDGNFTNPYAKKMSIDVDKDCLVVINGVDEVLIKPSLGMTISYEDRKIRSLICKTAGVSFYAIIGY